MTTTAWTKYETVESQRIQYVCKPWQYTYLNRMVERGTDANNGEERRVKPDKYDLIDHMTPQTVQWDEDERVCIWSYKQGQYNDYSCSPAKKADVIKTNHSFKPAFHYLTPTQDVTWSKDWATELRLKIKDETINLGTTLAEYRQSVNMFGDAAKAVVNAWRVFKGKSKRKRITPCAIPAAELIYTYGVAPLAADLYDSLEVLRLRLEHPLRRRYFTRADYSNSEDYTASAGTYSTSHVHASLRASQRTTAYITFDLDKVQFFNFGDGSLLNLGWTNPLELAWELIPYSFVIDGMIGIGDYLASLDALRAVDTIKVAQVTKRNFNMGFHVTTFNTYGTFGSSSPGYYKRKSHEREVYDDIPLPALPRWSPSKSYRKLVNNLALLWQCYLRDARSCKGRAPVHRK